MQLIDYVTLFNRNNYVIYNIQVWWDLIINNSLKYYSILYDQYKNNIVVHCSQVSFWSTSPELSNKQRFEYFTRTIPSDLYQVKVMVEIVRRLNWSYISIIYEESSYGIKAFEELEKLLPKHNICIAAKEKLVKDSGVAEEKAYDDIVIKLLSKPRAKGKIT